MIKILGYILILINLIVVSHAKSETIYDIKSKNKNTIVIEAFEPINHTQQINNKINFQEIKKIALNHCNTNEVDWDTSFKRGSKFNGVYQANRLKSITYTFSCETTSSTETVKISNSDKLSASKQICADLGFTSGTEKFGECVLEIMSINFTDSKKVANTNSNQSNNDVSSSRYSYQVDETEFKNVIKDDKYYKYVSKYKRTPDKELCIAFINRYSWYKNKTKNAARLEVIKNRGINCNEYMELAYYDQKERDKELADATQDLFNSTVENYYGVSGDSSNKSRTHCTTTNIGGMVQVFCKEY
tara:strand:- start:99 stop:1004 length:906 start_codon:yes stop_codon:yes gene_type:complete